MSLRIANFNESPISTLSQLHRNPAHYGSATVVTAELLQAGFYELVCYGTAHTDADSRNGLVGLLIEGGRGLNGLVITLAPNASFL
jgi:hypothetical protein